MELFAELFLTASLALFLSFLVAKLVAVAMASGDSVTKSARVSDEDVSKAVRFHGSESETKVEFVDETVEKVDHLREEIGDGGFGVESEISDDQGGDSVGGGGSGGVAVESAPNDAVCSEPDEARVLGSELEMKEEVNEVEIESKRSFGDDDDDNDDDWEGVERDELERDFMAAAKFVESRVNGGGDITASFVGGDVQMELYGLHRIATEGPCHEPLCLGLDLSDRAKWHAWQRLGNMTRETAMEQYINLLSENTPGWMDDHSAGKEKQECSESEGKFSHSVLVALRANERNPEVKAGEETVDLSGASDL